MWNENMPLVYKKITEHKQKKAISDLHIIQLMSLSFQVAQTVTRFLYNPKQKKGMLESISKFHSRILSHRLNVPHYKKNKKLTLKQLYVLFVWNLFFNADTVPTILYLKPWNQMSFGAQDFSDLVNLGHIQLC